MGSGSSKGSAKVVELNSGNNFGSKHKNTTESQNITDGFDEGKVTSSAKALAYDALKTKEHTSAVDEPTSSLDSLLASFSEQYPAIAPTFSLTREYYQGLKHALDGNKLLSPPSVGYANGLFSVYLTYKKPSNRFEQDFRITPYINYAYIHCLKKTKDRTILSSAIVLEIFNFFSKSFLKRAKFGAF